MKCNSKFCMLYPKYETIVHHRLGLTECQTFLIYRALTSQMAGLFEAKAPEVIFNSVVPVLVTSQMDLQVYLLDVVVSVVTLLHFL